MHTARQIAFGFIWATLFATWAGAAIPEAAQHDPRFKLGYLVVTHYPDVKNDGTGDSTAGIQQAIADAYEQNMTVLFPAGEYVISDSLKCYKYQLWSASRAATADKAKHRAENPPKSNHVLVGETSNGSRPVLRLAANAAGFGDPEKPRPMLAFRNFRAIAPEGAKPAEPENPMDLPDNFEDATANLFGEILCNIDFDCGGNPGAIGIKAAAAQDSSILNVRINAEGALVGLHGLPGRNSVTGNIEIQGGRIGIFNQGSVAGAVIVGARFINQTEDAIQHTDFSPLSMTGFEIVRKTGPGLRLMAHKNTSNGAMSLIDGRIEVGEGETAIDNSQGKTLYLRNVYTKGSKVIVQSGTQKGVEASGEWSCVSEYSYADQTVTAEDDPPYEKGDAVFQVSSLIDGRILQTPEAVVSTSEAQSGPPADLLSRHLWTSLPIYTGGEGVTNAASEFGATPDDDTDDAAAIQSAIDAASEAGHGWVFLPRGTYLISRTLELKANTTLSGAGWKKTVIETTPEWVPAKGETAVMVQTVDDAKARSTLAFLSVVCPAHQFSVDNARLATGNIEDLIPPRHYFTAIRWQAGRRSMILGPVTSRLSIPMHMSLYPPPVIHFTGGAGGRHYELHLRPPSAHPTHRGVLIENTTEPLAIYGLNSEKPYTPTPKDNVGMSGTKWGMLYALKTNVEIINSSNVRIYNMKREGFSPSVIVRDSENVALFSSGAMRGPTLETFGGYVQFEGDCRNVLASALMTQVVSENIGDLTKPQEPMLREAITGQEEILIRWPESVALYKRGNLDDGVFNMNED